jgi:hypothetical protein
VPRQNNQGGKDLNSAVEIKAFPEKLAAFTDYDPGQEHGSSRFSGVQQDYCYGCLQAGSSQYIGGPRPSTALGSYIYATSHLGDQVSDGDSTKKIAEKEDSY